MEDNSSSDTTNSTSDLIKLEPIPKIDRNIAHLFPIISNNAKE
jgi:hypothetical protein